MAGRSFNDLTQYPIFPWVIAEYSIKIIDLHDSRVYRDLSKPVSTLVHMHNSIFYCNCPTNNNELKSLSLLEHQSTWTVIRKI